MASLVGIVVLGVGATALFARSSDGPVGPLPGGPLVSGEWAPVPADWLQTVTRDIRAAEYRFSEKADGTLSAPNRAQGLRTSIDAGGIRVVPREEADDPWELRLRLIGVGHGNAPDPIGTPKIFADGRQPVDRDVFTRALTYYQIRTASR